MRPSTPPTWFANPASLRVVYTPPTRDERPRSRCTRSSPNTALSGELRSNDADLSSTAASVAKFTPAALPATFVAASGAAMRRV